jgi:hypothetical protein
VGYYVVYYVISCTVSYHDVSNILILPLGLKQPPTLSIGSYKSFNNQIISRRFLWFAEIYAKDYVPKLFLVEANMGPVRDIVGGVKFTSPRRENSVDVVE